MGLFDNVVRGVVAPLAEGDAGAAPRRPSYHDRKMTVVEEARERSKRAVHKQEVDRRHRLGEGFTEALDGTDAVSKHYDAAFLHDLALNPVPMAYIDTLSQDAASANWAIKPRNEKVEPADEVLADTEEFIRGLHPELTFRDVREQLARGVLGPGDVAYVKSFAGGKPENELLEATPVDASTFFKEVDEQGFTTGYVQVVDTDEDPIEFEESEITWVSWSPEPGRVYGSSPVFKSKDTIEVLEEIQEKEILDLIQGMPPGIVSRPAETDLPLDEGDWSNFKEDMRLQQGERHRFGFAKFPVEYTALTPNYQELQLIERYKLKVTELGGVFKVNPSYAGFDFENANRATDESQRESYQQRGFRVLLRLLESAINRGILWEHHSEDVRFEFEREQSTEERQTKANYYADAAAAGKELVDAGLSVSWRDDGLKIEDGPMDAGNASGGGEGGLFGMGAAGAGLPGDSASGAAMNDLGPGGPDAPGSGSNGAVEADGGTTTEKGGSGNATPGSGSNDSPRDRPLTKAEAEDLDAILYDAFEAQIMPEDAPGVEKAIWTSDRPIPEYVQAKIREAIDGDAVFRYFDSLPGRVRHRVEGAIEDALTNPDGWSLGGVVETFQEAFPGVSREQAEVVVRTETASVLNTARELGYEERDAHGDRGEARLLFKWVGPDDTRTTPACERLKELTNPEYTDAAGREGTPVGLVALKRYERRVHAEFFRELSFRDHVIHPNERHTFRRVLPFEVGKAEAPAPEEIEVSVAVGEECGAMTPAEYRAVVEKVAAHAAERSSREAEVEAALDCQIPGLLREVLDAADGAKRPALRAVNERLDAAGKPRDVSSPTFYKWAEKYHLA